MRTRGALDLRATLRVTVSLCLVVACRYQHAMLPDGAFRGPDAPAPGPSGADAPPAPRDTRALDAAPSPDAAPLPDAAPSPDAADPCGDGRTPGAEICNGKDDDCDGTTDEGCPTADALVVTGGARASSPIFGSTSLDRNMPFSHRCPPGQAAVAFTGSSGYAIDSLGMVCATLHVREDRGATPFRYTLSIDPGQSFEPVGGSSGGVNTATRCPPGFLITGISAWPSRPMGTCGPNYCGAGGSTPSCTTNFGLEILCSRFQIEGQPGSFRLTRVNEPAFRTAARVEVDLAPFGFPASKAEYACPEGQLVTDAVGSVGPWPYDCAKTTVNGLQAACTPPAIPMR